MEFNAPAGENLFDRSKIVGKSTLRIDGPLKVSGRAPYAAERHDVAANGNASSKSLHAPSGQLAVQRDG